MNLRPLLSTIILLAILANGWVFTTTANTVQLHTLRPALTRKQQSAEKIVTRDPIHGTHPPLKITDLTSDSHPIVFKKPFAGSDDWLKTLSFKLNNTSSKAIVSIVIQFAFPETRTTGNLMVYPKRLGQRPQQWSYTRQGQQLPADTSHPAMVIKPDETVNISLEVEFDKVKSFIEQRQAISSLNSCSIRIASIYFDDGTMWNFDGSYYKPDPNLPGHPIKIESEQ